MASSQQSFATRPGTAAGGARTAEGQEIADERRECVEQLQALTLHSSSQSSQAYVSKSREVDAVVTALNRNNENLKKQKATIIEQLQLLHKAVTRTASQVGEVVSQLSSSAPPPSPEALEERLDPPSAAGAAWLPAVKELYAQLRQLARVAATSAAASAAPRQSGKAPALCRVGGLCYVVAQAEDDRAWSIDLSAP